jgi:hypothetical protein
LKWDGSCLLHWLIQIFPVAQAIKKVTQAMRLPCSIAQIIHEHWQIYRLNWLIINGLADWGTESTLYFYTVVSSLR